MLIIVGVVVYHHTLGNYFLVWIPSPSILLGVLSENLWGCNWRLLVGVWLKVAWGFSWRFHTGADL